MRFLGRWLSNSIDMAFALLFAILAMQAPAFTREYLSALLQVTQDSRRDIEQRKASAQTYYAIGPEDRDDDRFVAALRRFEPSNADTLALSLERTRTLRNAYDTIMQSDGLARPIVAARDAAFDDPLRYKEAVWRTLLGTYAVQLNFDLSAAVYGLAGLLTGSFVAELLLSACRGVGSLLARPWRRRRTGLRHSEVEYRRTG
jgi:hypothetical protein